MRSSEAPQAAASGATSYPPVPLTGYYILFPSVPDGGHVIAITNLPEGTLYSTATGSYDSAGSGGLDGFGCCPAVHNGYMGAEGFNDSCNNPVGSIGNSSRFEITLEVRPDFSAMGISLPSGATGPDTSQPESVLAVLGTHFENLTGEQVTDLPNGAKELVATASYPWPDPQCGGNAYPLWGDPNCEGPDPGIDGPELKDAMQEVVGALSQARMCEFWHTVLTNDGRAKHPWPGFSDEWLAWYRDGPKNFSDGEPPRSSLTWEAVGTEGDSTLVDVMDDGTPVLELRMSNLQDCAYCTASMAPPWHVAAWTFLA
jgi:hypothetical protein